MTSAKPIPRCPHPATGYVSWPPEGPTAGKPHASRVTCARPQCIAATSTWVQATIGHPGTYRPFRRATR